eukprot:SAG11_NODE_8030_length_1067_cov_1.161157_2_plen_59_part_00
MRWSREQELDVYIAQSLADMTYLVQFPLQNAQEPSGLEETVVRPVVLPMPRARGRSVF